MTVGRWTTEVTILLTIGGMSVGAGSVDLLVHRWLGTTSAEVVGRRGAIDVIIHA